MWKGKSHYHNIAVKISIERTISQGRSDSLVSKASRVLPLNNLTSLECMEKILETHTFIHPQQHPYREFSFFFNALAWISDGFVCKEL